MKELLLVVFWFLLLQACLCIDQLLNIEIGQSTSYRSDLDSYPIVKVEGLNESNCSSCCKFGNSTFSPGSARSLNSSSAVIDPQLLENRGIIFNTNTSSFLVWINSTDNFYWTSNIHDMVRDQNDLDIQVYSWGALDTLTPSSNETSNLDLSYNDTYTPLGLNTFILLNIGDGSASRRHYLTTFQTSNVTGAMVESSIVTNYDFDSDLNRVYYKNGIFSFISNQTMNFGTLDLQTAAVNTLLSYNLTSIGLVLKDFYLCNDNISVIVVETRFNSDTLYLTTIKSFMEQGSIRTLVQCNSMRIITSYNSNLIITCLNSQSSNVEAYFLQGSSFADFIASEIPIDFPDQVYVADQSENLIYLSTYSSKVYYLFKQNNYTGFFDYGIFQGATVKGFAFGNSTSTDLSISDALVSFPYISESRVVTLIDFTFSSNDYGTMMVCNLPNTTYLLQFNVTTLLGTRYIISISRSPPVNPNISNMVKNIMITTTILLAMMLILGSFWLRSKKSKEEDVALEEFKLDYLKYSNKRSQNDSSSLINHDVN